MRYLLIYRVNISDLSHSGALIKMESQKRALQKLGHEVSLINHDSSHIYLDQKKVADINISGRWSRYKYNYNSFFKTLTPLDLSTFDCVYIRYPFANPTFNRFCKQVKSQNPSGKLILEMPTYPYNKEFKGIARTYTIIDNYYRGKLRSWVDYIVHFGVEKSLFGIPTITSSNGIDKSQFTIRSGIKKEGHIRLVAIGKWSYWHGLDRVIEGLKKYYRENQGKYNIDLTVVGEGTEIGKLRDSVDETIASKVCFVGILRGKELDAVFDQVDIGIGTLGIHRKGLSYNASLKHREYCVRGLPFILSTEDEAFDSQLSFVSYVPADESVIDMKAIIELYEKGVDTKEVREFAEENLSWERMMERVTKVVT